MGAVIIYFLEFTNFLILFKPQLKCYIFSTLVHVKMKYAIKVINLHNLFLLNIYIILLKYLKWLSN